MIDKTTTKSFLIEKRTHLFSRLGLVIISIVLALPAITNVWQAIYSRYVADEYQYSNMTRDLGIIKEQVQRYQEISGRFAFNFTICLLISLGRYAAPYIITGTLILFIVVWFFVFRQISLTLRFESTNLMSLLLVLIFCFVFFDQLPNPAQVLFWITGNHTYMTQYFPFALSLLIVIKQYRQEKAISKHIWIWYILLFLLVFWAGGYTEVFTVIQIVFWGVLFVLNWMVAPKPAKSRLMSFLITACIAAVLAALVVYMSPGNKGRQALGNLPPPPDFGNLMRMSFEFNLYFFKEYLITKPVFFISAVFLPLIVVVLGGRINNQESKHLPRRTTVILYSLLIIPIVGIGLIFISFLVPAYVLSYWPYDRILTTSYFLYTLTLVAWGMVAGLGLRFNADHSFSPALLVCLFLISGIILLFGPIRSTYRQIKYNIPVAQQFAIVWDYRDDLLTQAASRGDKYIAVPETINYYGLEQLKPIVAGQYNWVNSEMEHFYNIPIIDLQK